jgi:uncharacterized protein (TIGR00251 family)
MTRANTLPPGSNIEVTERGGTVVFAVRVQPRASRDEVGGEWQGALKVRLTAPPVDDKANEALRRLLAERLNVALAAVTILSGARGRTKRVAICGVTVAQILALAWLGAGNERRGHHTDASTGRNSEGTAGGEN